VALLLQVWYQCRSLARLCYLGHIGAGCSSRAFDERLHCNVALKQLRYQLEPAGLRAVIREIHISHLLKHESMLLLPDL
jgi:hypothetical protein